MLRYPLALSISLLLATGTSGCGDDGSEVTTETPPSGSTADPTAGDTGSSTDAPPTTTDPGDTTTDPSDTTEGAEDTTTTGSVGEPGQAVMVTNLGTIIIELDEDAAPITVANFRAYANAGFYDGTDGMEPTIFHRVVPDFVIQGGGLTEALGTKATMPPIVNESGNGLLNTRGTLSMARTMDPDSATSQFFINLVDNDFLDDPPGYAVFAEVVEGMDVVDAIAAVATTDMPPYEGVPVDPVIIMSVTVVE